MALIIILGAAAESAHYKEEARKRPIIPNEKECYDLAFIVLGTTGIENTEVYSRARELISAHENRQWSKLYKLRVEFVEVMIAHRSVYGSLRPNQPCIPVECLAVDCLPAQK